MTQDEFYNLILSPAYDFLRTDPHLGENIMFLTLGGSHAYGTNIEGSDVDVRGCAMNSAQDILGFSNFEQRVDTVTDTTIYGFNKLISLLLSCNPNTIELLGNKPDQYFYITPTGQMLLENKKLFLSQTAVHAFGGYANQQLRRLQNALAHDHYPQDEKERHILGTCKSVFENFRLQHADIPGDSVHLYIDKGVTEGMETEIFIDCDLKHYPLRNFKEMNSDLGTVIGQYAKLGKRNSKKDDQHLNKHAMHLVRLYLMCFDILEKGEINTYRENDRDFLLEIRAGKFQKPDGTYYQEFFDLIDEYEKRLEYDKKNTMLPAKPDYKRVEELVMEVNYHVCTARHSTAA